MAVPDGARSARVRLGIAVAAASRGLGAVIGIAVASVLISSASAVAASDGPARTLQGSRLHPPSLHAGLPFQASEGLRAQQTPTPEDDIPDVSLTLGGASYTLDVEGYFSDSVIGYEVSAWPSGIVRTSRSGTEITIEPLAAGSTTVTVTGRKLSGRERKRFNVTVSAMVSAPVTVGSIAAVSITEAATHTEDASERFEGEGVTYTAESSDTAVATVAVEGASVTVTAVAAGEATVTVTATNAGGSAGQSFTVTVTPSAPAAVGAIEAVTLAVGSARTITASGHFDGDGLTYAAQSSDTTVTTVAVGGASVTITAVALGSATVTVTATNAGGSAQQSFAVTVRIPPVALTGAGDEQVLELSDHFGDTVTGYSVAVSPAGIVEASLANSQLTLTAIAVGSATVALDVTSADAGARHELTVMVVPPAPMARGSIADVTLAEQGTHNVTVSDHFAGESVTYAASSSEPTVAAVAVDGVSLTVTALAAGQATITVTATNAGGSVEQRFLVRVELPGVTLVTGGGAREIELASYFAGEVTAYEVSVNPSGIVHVSRSGSVLTLTPVAVGEATLTATATTADGSAEQSFAVSVVPPAPTTVGSIEGVTLTEGATQAVTASDYFEGAGLTYAARSSDEAVATLVVEGASVTVTAVAAGEATVTVTATNAGGSAEQTFSVTVLPPAPTTVGSIAAVTLTEGATQAVTASDYFDGKGLTYAAQSSGEDVATVAVAGASLTVTAVVAGEATVTVTATNAGGSAEQAFSVTVLPPAPTAAGSIEAVTLTEGATHAVTASDYFEGKGLTYAAESSDTAVATVAVEGASVTVTAVAAGEATVTVTATNAGGSADQSFAVTAVVPAPVAVGSIVAATLEQGSSAYLLDLTQHFSGVVERYELSASPEGVVHLWQEGGQLTVSPLASGTTSVTVAAANAQGTATHTFLVTVEGRAPRALGGAPLVRLAVGGYSFVDAGAFLDGEGAAFAATSWEPDVATAEMHGATIVITAVAVGVARVTVTATNEHGSAAQDLFVLVSLRPPAVLDEIEDLTLAAGGDTRTLDLASHFAGASLRYGAVAEPVGVVHLWESDGLLTLTPLAPGSATVTVMAANSGGSASQSFEVSVIPAAPRALAGRTQLELAMGGTPLVIDLTDYFSGSVEGYELTADPGNIVHLWESGGLLTMTPLAPGLASVTVTARSGDGRAGQVFAVVVTPGAPTPLGRIVRASLREGGDGQEIALADYFGGEVARYEVSVRPSGVVHLWESGGRLRLTPLSAGVATVTVTAANGSGSAAQVFAIAVRPGAPLPAGRIEGVTLDEGGAALHINLAEYFRSEAVRYSVSADPGGVVHAWEAGGGLWLTPLAAGVARVSVTAANSAGSAEQVVVVTVDPAAPRVLGVIEDLALARAGPAAELDLADHFAGGVTGYRLSVDAPGVVHLWESGGRLRLTPLAPGVARVEVTALNGGGSTSLAFTVSVEAIVAAGP